MVSTATMDTARAAGDLAPGLDPVHEAAALVGFVDGLALQALFDPERFPAGPPAGCAGDPDSRFGGRPSRGPPVGWPGRYPSVIAVLISGGTRSGRHDRQPG